MVQKTPQETPKTSPRDPKDLPKGPQRPPKLAHISPSWLKFAFQGSPKHPEGLPKPSGTNFFLILNNFVFILVPKTSQDVHEGSASKGWVVQRVHAGHKGWVVEGVREGSASKGWAVPGVHESSASKGLAFHHEGSASKS